MKYFKAIKLLQYPFIQWTKIAEYETIEDFESSDWSDDPLVKAESDIVKIFGTYPYQIVDGAFVDYTTEELVDLEKAFTVRQAMAKNRNRIETLNTSTFTYDGHEFPMDDASRLFYSTFDKISGSKKIFDIEAFNYGLLEENIPDFMAAYYAQLNNITQHDD